MPEDPSLPSNDRRSFLRGLAVAGLAGRTLLRTGEARAAVHLARQATGKPSGWPTLEKRPLGKTGFVGSRLVFGCGAALSRQRRDDLLEAALDAGINVFDNGFRGYYRDAETNLAPFLAKHRSRRDEIFLISKAIPLPDLGPNDELGSDQARQGAANWTAMLDRSLGELGVESVDAYYVMAANNPALIASEEMRTAFERARAAGKARHWGLSTHQNAEKVLEAAMETGAFSLAQIAITPAGWYDWADKNILEGTASMAELRPFLDRVRASGIALIGMKAGRYLAGRKFLGWGKPTAFDDLYPEPFRRSGLSPFQRSYAYVLAHGLDAVNADMQNFLHLEENVTAAATSTSHFAQV